jgi:biotin carboxyl carrier protein
VTIEVEVGGRTRTVTVERLGHGRFRVVLDGVERVVDAVRWSEFGLSILDPRTGASRNVLLAPAGAPGGVLVTLDGRTVAVTVNGRRRRRGADSGAQADGEQAVLAPMPGRVVRVLVSPGDEVAARQGVIVVEAMKMENELRAPKAGRVKEISVTPGTSVEAGRVLVVVV